MFTIVEDPILNSLSARFYNTGPKSRIVGFFPIAMSSDADRIYAYWRGVVDEGSAARFEVWLGDTHFGVIGGVQFYAGQIRLMTPSGHTTIGEYDGDVSHFMLFTFNRTAGTFSVNFVQRGRAITATDTAVVSPMAAATRRPTLYMEFPTGERDQYIVDDVVISERAPTR